MVSQSVYWHFAYPILYFAKGTGRASTEIQSGVRFFSCLEEGIEEMKNTMVVLVAAMAATVMLYAETEVVDRIVWQYQIKNNQAIIYGTSETDPAIPIGTEGSVVVPVTLGGCPVVEIGAYSFANCKNLKNIVINEGVERFGREAFYGCGTLQSISFPKSLKHIGNGNIFYGTSAKAIYISDLQAWMNIDNDDHWSSQPNCDRVYLNGVLITELVIPDGVKSIRGYCFSCFKSIKRVIVPSSVELLRGSAFSSSVEEFVFCGRCPAGIEPSNVLNCKSIRFRREYAADFFRKIPVSSFGGYLDDGYASVTLCRASIRTNDPTILEVTYRVKSVKPTVKVRALAFKDGVRSFANVVRPETFIDGTDVNVGDAISANAEHKLTWRVSSDWQIDLAKVKFEVLAVEEDLLPLELVTIPANGTNRAMEISWNAITEAQVFDALLWLYADKTEGLTLANGVLKDGSVQIASGTSITATKAVPYVFTKMGFSTLSGDELTYANAMTRLGLSPSGVCQYAYRWIEAQ